MQRNVSAKTFRMEGSGFVHQDELWERYMPEVKKRDRLSVSFYVSERGEKHVIFVYVDFERE